MKGGKIYAACDKWGVTPELISDVYGIEVDVIFHNDLPVVIPR